MIDLMKNGHDFSKIANSGSNQIFIQDSVNHCFARVYGVCVFLFGGGSFCRAAI